MSVQESEQLWGGETTKAVANFPISGEPVPVPVVRWLGRIKGASARVNAELGLMDSEVAERIAAAADRVAEGEFDDQFPIDVFQTGSGTSSNMNTNEVIATLASRELDRPVHPNDHVNASQSSNDVFPSSIHLAATEAVTHDLGQFIPAIPFASFIGRDTNTVLSLQQIAQSADYRTNFGLVEGSGNPVTALISIFGSDGKKLTEFTQALNGGQLSRIWPGPIELVADARLLVLAARILGGEASEPCIAR